ncbi:MAG: phenylalanine--tRNA ligase subunit beta [Deltaproteobacteria bacterium]|nr:phenylalanine--tRNA ligase subunit beta [Deltaproteobacteria bacterium]
MIVSLNWLRDYVDIQLPPDEIGRLLTMIGLEVEGMEAFGRSLDSIIVSRILSVEPHPQVERLSVCRVDAGEKSLSVVCGAPNLEPGVLVPLALPGVRLPDGTEIRESDIRGVVSEGVLLAEDELGLTDDHTGVLVLPPGPGPGVSLPEAVAAADWVFDISITPNRPDCACILGVAREIAAATGARLKRPEIRFNETGPPIEDLTRVDIEDPVGCPRYVAGIIQGVAMGPSPFWMRYRLHLCGIRSINNIVDVTNYVLLEMGQPLHAFDYHRLKENRIVVKRASSGDRFTTLDGEARALSDETLMICDAERQVAVAGIMGGLNSEIFSGSRDVLVESAFFDPITIRRGSKALGLSTEASYRFERGIDMEGAATALKRAVGLMGELAGGQVASGIVDNYPKPYAAPRIPLRVAKTNRFLGTDISGEDMRGYLEALEIKVEGPTDDALTAVPPSFRVDLTREVDLMEEVARLYGYDNIPVTYPSVRPSEEPEAPELALRDRTRTLMCGLGFNEVITYSFISPDSVHVLGGGEDTRLRAFVRLMNPITVDASVMRTSLAPGLMGAVQTNVMHEERNLRLFEWGKVFIQEAGEELPREKLFLAGIMAGLCREKAWFGDERPVDFYDIKGAVETLLKGMGAEGAVYGRREDLPGYDGEIAAHILYGGEPVGSLGRVSPEVHAAYGLEPRSVYMFELDMGTLLKHLPDDRQFHPYARFPAVYRDLSLIVDGRVESGRILDFIRDTGGKLVESAHIFDVYQGKAMGESEKAIAFRICYRSSEGTLDGTEINSLHESIIDRIREKTGGRLREG